ncbi:hypothetical protein C3V36_09530 [Lachnospiraceae bacterium oral taxon 500]|nr:hypothetical protein C3V36_09530 [Lachnospiraceae bacterium oral taxon 500]
MAYTQENFQEWIFHISDKMDEFTDEFAKENHLILDYTLASLDDLEKWILEHYSDAHELIADAKILDRLGIYIGETYRKYLGGKWVIDLKNKKNVYYAMPAVSDPYYQDKLCISPMPDATACISRNRGNYISRILINRISERTKTIDKLVEFMENECYAMDSFSVEKYQITEDLFLDRDGEDYVFGYSEKGNRHVEKRFENQQDAVKYVFKQIYECRLDDSHLVAWTWDSKEIEAAEKELQQMFISFKRNDIPGFDLDGRTAYRIYAFGKNIKYLDDFQKKYRRDLSNS